MAVDFEAGSSQALQLPRPNAYVQNRGALSVLGWIQPETNVNANMWGDSTNNGGTPTSDTRVNLKSTTSPANGIEMGVRAPDSGGTVVGSSGGGELANGTWQHIGGAANVAGDALTLYVAGAVDSTPAVAYTNAATDNTTSASGAIGAEENDGAPFQDGLLADILVYNRLVTLAEVQTIHATRGALVAYAGLVGRWLLKELGAGTAVSAARNSCDGTNAAPINAPVYAAGRVRFRREIG